MIDNVVTNKSQILFLNENAIFKVFSKWFRISFTQQIKSKNYYDGEYKGFDIEKN